MEKIKYDIFISYRRIGGKNYARTLKPELEKRGFRVFLDFDELKDGVFDKRIMDAINEAPIFLVILSKGALDRCVNDGDWVREEILYADKTNRHIVPVEVDKTFRDFPENLPQEVKAVLGPHQFSQIDTETLMQESIDKMVRERIKPYVTNISEAPSSLKEESSEGAEIHIEVDADCDMFRFKKLLKELHSGEDNVVHLMPGKHKVEFLSKEYPDIKTSQVITIPSIHYSDFIEISLSERITIRKQEEIRIQEEQRREEEARRLEEQKRIEEARLLEEQKRIEEEQRRIEKEKQEKKRREKLCKIGSIVKDLYADKIKYEAMSAHELSAEAVMREHDCEYRKALRLYLKAVQRGRQEDYARIGNIYLNGLGIEADVEQAFFWYKKAAENGDAKAQKIIGDMYYYGSAGECDQMQAAIWYEKASEQDDFTAQYFLGYMYMEGIGVSKNIDKAKQLLLNSAQHGYSKANEKLKELEKIQIDETEELTKKAYGLLNRKQRDKALETFLSIANICTDFPSKGKVYNEIGEILRSKDNENGYEEDYAEVIKWFRKSAEEGYAWGQYNLAKYYFRGKGVECNYPKSLMLYKNAAEQGLCGAQLSLGYMYSNGIGVSKNVTSAVGWYQKAAEQGALDAQIYLADTYYNGIDMDKDYEKAAKWYKKAAEQGHVKSLYKLGNIFFRGEGVEQDYKMAVYYYQKAAELGSAIAQLKLGTSYENGWGVEPNEEESIKWYQLAVNQDNEDAKKALQRIKDKKEAAKRWEEKLKQFRQSWDGMDVFIGEYALVWNDKVKLYGSSSPNYSDCFSLIDKTGKLIMPLKKNKWEYVSHIGYGLIKVGKNGNYGLLNSQGEEILPTKYRFMGTSETYFDDGYVYVIYEPFWGKHKKLRIDTKGNITEGWGIVQYDPNEERIREQKRQNEHLKELQEQAYNLSQKRLDDYSEK